MIYSHSRLECFHSCPKKYEFQYVLKPDVPQRDSIQAFMGQRVHETIEHFYRDLHLTKVNSLKEMIKYYEKIWKEHWKKDIVMKKGFSTKHFHTLGKKCLKNFYESVHRHHNGDVLGIEKLIHISLDENHKMRGYIDLLVKKPEDHFEIIDFKTGKLEDQAYRDKNNQLAIYQIAIQKEFPEAKKIDLVWHYLAFNHTGKSSRTPQQIAHLRQSLIHTIDQIERTKKFETKVSKLCDYCTFKPLCPAWKHDEILQKLPATKYKKEEGLLLADEYAKTYHDLKDAEKELAAQLTILKDKIFDYAKQHGFEIIQGTDCKLKLKVEEKISFPGKNDKERKVLEELIRKHDLWEKLSDLDSTKLKHAFEERELDEKTMKELSKMVKHSETKTITISKK